MAVHSNESPPLVRGVFDRNAEGVKPPEYNDGGFLYGVKQVAHQAGNLACIGQCLEPDLDRTAEKFTEPSNVPRGSTLRIDTGRDGVTAMADLSGQWPLYYSTSDTEVHYSSDAEELARRVGDQVDPIALAYYVIGGEFLDPIRTAYACVRRLPAGHALRIDHNGTSVWEYAPLVPDPNVRFADTADELRHHLRDAVLLGSTGDDDHDFYAFSGGYDSTSLAFLRAASLSPGNRLRAYHTQRLASLSGDTAHAISFAALDPQIDLAHIIIPDELVPYGQLNAANTRYPFSQNDGVVKEIVEYQTRQLAERGAALQVSGGGGDALFTAPPQYLADLAEHPFVNAGRFVREGTLIAHEGEVAFTGLVKAMRAQAGFSYPRALRSIASAIHPGGNDGILTWHNVTAEAVPLLMDKMRQQLAEIIHDKSQCVASEPSVGVADFVNWNDIRLSGRFTANLRRSSQPFNIATRAPYLDDPVVAARFRLQTHLMANPDQFKNLLRVALDGYVPEEVFARPTKGSHSREAYQGIRENARALRALFGSDSYLAALGVINPTAFQQLIAMAELGQPVPLDALERATSVELWLRDHYGDVVSAKKSRPVLPQQLKVPDIGPVVPSESLPLTIHVPLHVRIAEADIGAVAFNLKTSVAHNLHTKSALVLKSLQQRGMAEDAAAALRNRYPLVDAALLSQDLTDIMTDMLNVGTIEAGDFVPFTIRPAQERSNDASGEVRMIRGKIDKTGVKLGHYIRMGRALLRATKLGKSKDLDEVTKELQYRKQGLPPSNEESIHRHMVAGHVLARYILNKAIVCEDLASATVLAEAMRGRAADYILAFVPDPNYYHAAPGVRGKPIQTPLDRVMDDNYTILGIF